MKPRVTAERLRELLHYAPETGLFYWRRRCGSAAAGRLAGRRRPGGYCIIVIARVHYYAHRLAWLHVHGRHPVGIIDHANGDAFDDRIANLRECSRSENAWNMRTRSTSGFKGVRQSPKRPFRWHARITANAKCIHLGAFDTPQEAAAAYDAAARRYHGEFARTNADLRDMDRSSCESR